MLDKSIFEKQLETNKIIILETIKMMKTTHYYNGDPVEIGDQLLYALLLKDDGNSIELITLKESHYNLFEFIEKRSIDSVIPVIKLIE